MAKKYAVSLIGGDTCKGPLSITVQIHGIVPKGQALLRSKAQVDDNIYVTGSLGDAGLSLQTLLNKQPKLATENQLYIESRLNQPTPRVEIAQAIRSFAHACIDISDGFSADLAHILTASKVGAVIDMAMLPLSNALKTIPIELAHHFAMDAGDDYELCFSADPKFEQEIQNIAKQYDTPITYIGQIQHTPGLFIKQDGKTTAYHSKGYQHF